MVAAGRGIEEAAEHRARAAVGFDHGVAEQVLMRHEIVPSGRAGTEAVALV